MKKVSIVIPAHNEEESIAATIKAALEQEYQNFEVIVVNNCSTDKTFEIASAFPVKVVTEDNKGLLFARERGRKEAVGDIIANIDADCLPDRQWLKNGISLLERSGAVALSGPYNYYDMPKMFMYTSLFIQKYMYRIMNIIIQSRFIKKGAVLIGGNNLILSEVLQKMNGYTTEILFYGEDTDTAKKVSRYGKVLFDKNFIINTSGRRFKNQGIIKISGIYIYYFFKVIFKN